MIEFKINVMNALKESGYTSYRIRQEKIFGEKTLQDFRQNKVVYSADCLNKLCSILNLDIGDLLQFKPDESEN